MWTPGASWIAHWYYDHYQYTGDQTFLRERAIPFMEQCALFWEDFLEGHRGRRPATILFRPSIRRENGWGDNASQDIEITTRTADQSHRRLRDAGHQAGRCGALEGPAGEAAAAADQQRGPAQGVVQPDPGREQRPPAHDAPLRGVREPAVQRRGRPDAVRGGARRPAQPHQVLHGQASSTHGRMHIGPGATDWAWATRPIIGWR